MINNQTLAMSEILEKQYKNACLAEIEALKPGNVHVFADGHGMHIQDFIRSAEQSAPVITQVGLHLGECIYQSVDATWQAVGCNTNLGIILLCAPIIQSLLTPSQDSLQIQLKQMIDNATEEDTEWLFKAIRLANPGGLGEAEVHDVNEKARCTLIEAMQASAGKDFIAMQYSNGFMNIFNEGLHQYREALLRTENSAWAITELYLYWLSRYSDSHVLRKHGLKIAQRVQLDALLHYKAFKTHTNPKRYFSELLAFDQALKAEKINPGTCADLTVATTLLHESVTALQININ